MFLKFFIIFNYLLILTNAFKCIETTRSEIENHLSTKTPYRVISNRNDQEIKFKDCTPIKIWSLIRHGTRNPSRRDIQRCKEDLTRIREKILMSKNSQLCPHEFVLFRNWSCNNLNENEAKYLVYEGVDELIELAERMHNRFPELLIDEYYPTYYKFKFTAKQRTFRSAQSFAIGLFGRHNIHQISYPNPIDRDPVLRFYKLCYRWRYEVDKNPDTFFETNKFLYGYEMKKLSKSISRRTGVLGVSPNDIMLMYKFCAFETAWNKKRFSPWCLLFKKETIQIPEFVDDLKYYWKDGYANEITYKQACPVIKDMMDHIRPESTYPNATFYFTHSGTILKMLAHLGLYRDDFILTHSDFEKTRKWKTSKIDSFASNIVFVTFDCADEPKVLVLHQERIVHLPGCPDDSDLCSLKTIESIFEDSTQNCQFEEMCRTY